MVNTAGTVLKTSNDKFLQRHPIEYYDPAKPWPPELWLVEDMFFTGSRINFVLGKEKSGKSRFTLWLIAHMLADLRPFGLRVDKPPGKILWVLGEESIRNTQWRLTRYAELLGVDPEKWKDRIAWMPGAGMSLERGDKRSGLVTAILAEKADLVVIDPLRRVHNAAESQDRQFDSVLNAFREWTQRYEIDILVQHHTGKVGEDADWGQISTWARGTSDIAGILDSAVYLQRFSAEDEYGGSRIKLLRGGRHAPDDKKWILYDLGREDKDRPSQTDRGWKMVKRG